MSNQPADCRHEWVPLTFSRQSVLHQGKTCRKCWKEQRPYNPILVIK